MTKYAVVIAFERDNDAEALALRDDIAAQIAPWFPVITLHKDMRPTIYPFPPFTLVNTEASSQPPSVS